jgi:flagellar hook-basal body complex protein FliE
MVPITQVAMSLFGGSLDGVVSVQPQAVVAPTQADAITTAPFADLITESMGQVDLLERQARSSVQGLMSGTGVDVHEAMIATEKAEMGFELVLAVRNKALAAYQQVMGMQF